MDMKKLMRESAAPCKGEAGASGEEACPGLGIAPLSRTAGEPRGDRAGRPQPAFLIVVEVPRSVRSAVAKLSCIDLIIFSMAFLSFELSMFA